MKTGFWSAGTAVPRQCIEQGQVLDFMRDCYPRDKGLLRRLDYIYRRSQIERRYSCCPEFGSERRQRTHARSFGQRTTAERMALYEREAGSLALAAAAEALGQAPFTAGEITHLLLVTCTGFSAPGPELAVIEGLGLSRDIRRLQIGFMGCQAALHGLQTADAICRADDNARVLLVCVELCTLHFNSEASEENLVVNSLFGDGAAAMVLAAVKAPQRLQRFTSRLVREGRELISWRIGDSGFNMGLDMAAPAALRAQLPGFVDALLHDLDRSDLACWAVHPGGRAILDVVERSLDLSAESLAPSRAVLREYGNMSSPAVLFVLQRFLNAGDTGPGAILSFGPGLSMEGALWECGDG